MTHPESDGAAEMLEGAHRAALTAALRVLELYNRRTEAQTRNRRQPVRPDFEAAVGPLQVLPATTAGRAEMTSAADRDPGRTRPAAAASGNEPADGLRVDSEQETTARVAAERRERAAAKRIRNLPLDDDRPARYDIVPGPGDARDSPTGARGDRTADLAHAGYDPDIVEAALIHDLSFGTPAAESVASRGQQSRPARTARRASRGAERQRHGVTR